MLTNTDRLKLETTLYVVIEGFQSICFCSQSILDFSSLTCWNLANFDMSHISLLALKLAFYTMLLIIKKNF